MTGIEKCKNEEVHQEKVKQKKRIRMFDSFMKILTFIVVAHGLIMVTMSYILAFMDKIQIAESLSQTVVTEIIAPVTIYGITKTIENVSKYNTWVNTIFNKEDSNGYEE